VSSALVAWPRVAESSWHELKHAADYKHYLLIKRETCATVTPSTD